MLRRLIIATLALCAALALYMATAAARQPLTTLALSGVGERFYAVRLKHLPVGQLTQSAIREPTGNYRFSSRLEFQLDKGQPVRVFESKVFAGVPPFALLWAEQQDTTAASTNSMGLKRLTDKQVGDTPALEARYAAEVTRGANVQNLELNWQHGLSDYLAVEQWLPNAEIGATANFASIDFDRMRLRKDAWTLLARTDEGYEVTKSSRVDATRLFLDNHFKPLRFSMAGTFEIETVNPEDLPVTPEPVFHSQTYQVPLDQPIERHQSLQAMTLKVGGNAALVDRWESATTEDGLRLLRSRAETHRPGESADTERYTREELSYPLSAEKVQALADIAVDKLSSASQQAEQLTHFVYNYIDYDHHSTMQNVLDVIATQRGDCNEYAELFTTLGRAIGLPVRTVFGLAYTDEYQPAFALHAWNEVLLDSRWQAFDPTWDQTRVDATHLPLPDDAGGMLTGITTLDELTFSVHSLSYSPVTNN